jgi:putative transposase
MSRHQQQVIAYLVEENRVLREQLGDRRLKFNDDQRRRLAAKAKRIGRKTLGQVATIAAPETLLTWYRNLIGGNYAGTACRTPGRRPTPHAIAALAVRMAEENRSWGYRRIQGALANLGHDLAHNTIRNILKAHGIEPAPQRARKTTWREFLQRHWEQIVGSDFFGMKPSKASGLASLVIFCFMKLSACRAEIGRSASETDGPPTIQFGRNGKRDHIQGLGHGIRNCIAEVCSRTHYRKEPPRQKVENRLLLPFASSSHIGKGHQRRDRLLSDDKSDAAA